MARGRRIRRGCLSLALVAAALMGIAWLVVVEGRRLMQSQDYSTLPPEVAFERIFGCTVPPGVTGLRAGGHGDLGNYEVRLQACATDRAISFLVRGAKRLPDVMGPDIGRSEPFLTDEYGRQAGLEEAALAAKLERYELPGGSQQPGYGKWLYVDRERHLVYAVERWT